MGKMGKMGNIWMQKYFNIKFNFTSHLRYGIGLISYGFYCLGSFLVDSNRFLFRTDVIQSELRELIIDILIQVQFFIIQNIQKIMISVTNMPGNAIFVLEFAQCYLYKFQNKVRIQIAQGSCDIFESQTNDETVHQQKVMYLSIQQLLQVLTSSQVFVKIQYAGSYCLVYENSDHQIYCLSIQKHNKEVQSLLIKFAQNFKVVNWSSEQLDQTLRESIKLHCSENIEKEDIGYDGKRGLRRVSINIGLLSGKLSKIMKSKAVTDSVGAISERANRLSESYVNQSKWNAVKEKSQAINEKLTRVVKPVVNIFDNITTSIGNSFYKSENKFIKAFRQYSLTIRDSLNDGNNMARENDQNMPTKEVSNAYLNEEK